MLQTLSRIYKASCSDVLFSNDRSLQYYAESHGVIYVIDSTDEERLSESKEAFGTYETHGYRKDALCRDLMADWSSREGAAHYYVLFLAARHKNKMNEMQ